ncbi:hypothetical protein Tco_0507854 [Tanacetum coccineum]
MCPVNRYNYMTSNSDESINNLTGHVRKAPVMKLMEWYRALLQKWYCDRREKYKGIPCGNVIAVARVMGCTDCSELALGWFRKTTLYSTYQELVYPLGESSTRHCPDGLQVVKPPKMDFPKPSRPKKVDRIKSQGEEPIQYEYEAAYNNKNGRSQEYAGANNNNYGRTQEYEYKAAYNNNNGRSQEYAGAYNNNYGRSQEYAGAYFNGMYDQPNNMGFAFNFGQSSQQTNSTWDHVNLDDP